MESGLYRRALWLSYFTVGYNVLEGVLSVLAGLLTGSIALVGFGLDSAVESLSGGVMVWRFRKHGRVSEEEEERVERKAARLVGYTFFILAAYVAFEAGRKLLFREIPEPSLFGIAIALASLVVMPVLYYLKRDTGRRIKSAGLEADAKQTLACVLMSLALLLGLGLNYLFGLWQADPMVALAIAGYLVKEGRETLREGES